MLKNLALSSVVSCLLKVLERWTKLNLPGCQAPTKSPPLNTMQKSTKTKKFAFFLKNVKVQTKSKNNNENMKINTEIRAGQLPGFDGNFKPATIFYTEKASKPNLMALYFLSHPHCQSFYRFVMYGATFNSRKISL